MSGQMLEQHLEAGGLAVVVAPRPGAAAAAPQTLSLSAAAERAPALVQEAVPC
jgi:hypothetical protein